MRDTYWACYKLGIGRMRRAWKKPWKSKGTNMKDIHFQTPHIATQKASHPVTPVKAATGTACGNWCRGRVSWSMK